MRSGCKTSDWGMSDVRKVILLQFWKHIFKVCVVDRRKEWRQAHQTGNHFRLEIANVGNLCGMMQELVKFYQHFGGPNFSFNEDDIFGKEERAQSLQGLHFAIANFRVFHFVIILR